MVAGLIQSRAKQRSGGGYRRRPVWSLTLYPGAGERVVRWSRPRRVMRGRAFRILSRRRRRPRGARVARCGGIAPEP